MSQEDEDDLAALGFAPAPVTEESAPKAPEIEPEPEPEPEEAPEEPPVAVAAPPALEPEEPEEPEEVPPPPVVEPVAAAPPPPTAAPQTPAEVEIVVDVEPSPGAIKFMDTFKEVGSKVSTLEASEWSDGMLELSRQCTRSVKETFSSFKEHTSDLVEAAKAEPPPGDKSWKVAARQAEWKKLAQLPLAAMYAFLALMCVCAFAAIHYPKKYAPLLLDKAKAKFIEWKVAEHATNAATVVKPKLAAAYAVAEDGASKAYAAAAPTVAPVLNSIAEKTAAAYEQGMTAVKNATGKPEPSEVKNGV